MEILFTQYLVLCARKITDEGNTTGTQRDVPRCDVVQKTKIRQVHLLEHMEMMDDNAPTQRIFESQPQSRPVAQWLVRLTTKRKVRVPEKPTVPKNLKVITVMRKVLNSPLGYGFKLQVPEKCNTQNTTVATHL